MAITTVDQALAGMQYPREFVKALTGTMVAGRPHSLWYIGGVPGAGATPYVQRVYRQTIANPTSIICYGNHGLTNNDRVSIIGNAGGTDVNGFHTATVTGATTFTIPINVLTQGFGGTVGCMNPGGSGYWGLSGSIQTSTSSPTPYGKMPWTNPTSGNTYLARLQGQCLISGSLLLCDRLWENCGIDAVTTTEQLFTNASQIPPRDATGTNAGVGVMAALEVAVATGATAPAPTLKYTNSAGTTGKTTTLTYANVASSVVGSFYPFGLAAGDLGIQKAESLTWASTQTSGFVNVVLYRVLARLELTAANVPNAIDALTSGFPRLYDETVPFLVFIPSTTTTSNISGHVIWTQG